MTLSADDKQPDKFAEYYREASLSDEAMHRFLAIRGVVRGVLAEQARDEDALDVADIGCGAGTQSTIWANDGHRVSGLDINTDLLAMAKERAREQGLMIEYLHGSAESLPWDDDSMDVCLVPELLEHVVDWESCLREMKRVLRPNGVLYLSTNNVLCPVQQEFDLPMYSWYPAPLKRHFEKLAVTSRPELVNHAEYPAIHWFSFYRLRREFATLGMEARDRFQTVRLDSKSMLARFVIRLIRAIGPLRFVAHIFTPYTAVVVINGKENQ